MFLVTGVERADSLRELEPKDGDDVDDLAVGIFPSCQLGFKYCEVTVTIFCGALSAA